jgi:hypothetical protein
MKQPAKDKNQAVVEQLLSGKAAEQYHGKQVVVMGGKPHILPEDDRQAVVLVEKLEQQYPRQIPRFVFVPRPETYVL